jgi:hypothetical protein
MIIYIDELMKKIKSLNDTLVRQLTYNSEKFIDKTTTEDQTKAGISAGKDFQITIDDFISRQNDKEVQYVGKTLAYGSAAGFIVEFFKQLNRSLYFPTKNDI